ncbi:MAG: NAD(P)H-binding protein [Chromatiales bacterium]|nr:NAD(P)H-binding protein [Chromatiales bacterium]
MTIAITAASGRLGHAILRELVRQGRAGDVVAVARDPRRVGVAGIETRPGDYGSLSGMTTALAGIDTVVMISAPVAGGGERIPLHRNVIEAARRAGVRRLLFTSVIGNGLEMATLFGPTQQVNRQTEADLQASGLEWVIGRNGLYLELDLVQMRKAQESGIYSNPAGSGRCPYITIDEIAYAYARLAVDGQQAGQIYNITSENLTQAEILGMASEIFGLNVRYEAMSDEACIAKFRTLMPERGEAVARMLTGCFQSIRAGAFDVPSHFREAAGRPPRTVRQMLEGLAAAQKSS